MSNQEITTPISHQTPPGWGISLTGAICEECDGRYLLPPEVLPQPCPHCFQAALVPVPEMESLLANHPPELYLPFTISAERVGQSIQQFAKTIWFAPADLTPQNLQNRLQRVYIPQWLVDSGVQATWQAEAGFNYEAISYQETYDQNQGQWNSQRLTETRVRWEPRVGRLRRRYENIAAPALEEDADLQRRLGAYETEKAQPYRAEVATGALIRLPNRPSDDAWPDAVPGFQANAAESCHRACQADHLREFRWEAHYDDQNWTLLLMPLYSTYYLDDAQQPQPILIHGQSGRLDGPRRASMKRARTAAFIIAGVAVTLFAASLVIALLSIAARQLFVLASLGLIVAILVGLAALLPIAIAWQFNRTQPSNTNHRERRIKH